MTLYLSDLSIRGGARPAGDDPPEILSLPRRLPAAAAVTGRLVAEHAPDVVVVLSGSLSSRSDDELPALGVVYRLNAGGDIWIPDVLYDHDGEALCVVAQSNEGHTAGSLVSPAFAGAFAAAISLLGPDRVVGVLSGTDDVTGVVGFAETLAKRCEATVLRANAMREGAEHIQATRELCVQVADRLRLTTTQRARFARAARAAAVRCGGVPRVIEGFEHGQRVGTKTEAKRRLAVIEAALNGVARAEV